MNSQSSHCPLPSDVCGALLFSPTPIPQVPSWHSGGLCTHCERFADPSRWPTFTSTSQKPKVYCSKRIFSFGEHWNLSPQQLTEGSISVPRLMQQGAVTFSWDISLGQVFLSQGFSALTPLTFRPDHLWCGRSLHCRILGSFPGLFPTDARSILQQLMQIQHVPRHCQVSHRGQNHPGGNHCSMVSPGLPASLHREAPITGN